MNGMNFQFVCHGERLAGFDRKHVIENLEKLYGSSSEQFAELLDKKKWLKIDKIDKFTANHYREMFAKCGLEGVVEEISEEIQDESVPVQSNDNDDTHNSITSKPQSSVSGNVLGETDSRIQATEQDEINRHSVENRAKVERTKAFRRLSWAMIAWFTVSFLSGYLASSVSYLGFGVDIGSAPYYVVIALFGYASIALAKSRGYSGLLGGILGLTTFPGIAVLLLLPNKLVTEENTAKNRLLVLTAVVLSTVWLFQLIDRNIQEINFEQKSFPLIAEYAYPSEKPLNNKLEVENLFDELSKTIVQGIKVASKASPDRGEAIFDTLLNQAASFFMMLQYQSILNERSNNAFDQEWIQKLQNQLNKVIADEVKKSNSVRLFSAYQQWYVIAATESKPLMSVDANRLNAEFVQFRTSQFELYRRFKLIESEEARISKGPENIKVSLSCQDFQMYTWSCRDVMNKNAIEIQLTNYRYTGIQGKTIVLVPQMLAYRRNEHISKFNPVKYRLTFVRVGGTLSDKYIYNQNSPIELIYQ